MILMIMNIMVILAIVIRTLLALAMVLVRRTLKGRVMTCIRCMCMRAYIHLHLLCAKYMIRNQEPSLIQ